MNKNLLIGIIVVVLIAGAGWFLLKSQSAPVAPTTGVMEDKTPPTTESTMEKASPESAMEATGTPTTTGTKEFTITGSNFKFDTAQIKVKKGDTVKITFKNAGGFHDFVIDEFNVKAPQANGPASEEVTFVASKVGEFEYYCSVGQHRAMGMKGKLIVE